MTKKLFQKMLAFALAVLLVFGVCVSPIAAANKGSYIYFGDSMSFRFGRRHNWIDNDLENYPMQIANKYGYDLIGTYDDGPFSDSPYQLVRGGIRATDIYALISNNDYQGDAYTRAEFGYWFDNGEIKDNQKNAAIKEVSEASLITMMLGHSNLSVYLGNNILTILQGKDPVYGMDFGDLFADPAEREKYQQCVEKYKAELKKWLPQSTQEALDELVKEEESLNDQSGKINNNSIKDMAKIIKDIGQAMLYAVVSDIVDFDRLIKRLTELKQPDTPIYVMGLYNPMENINFSFTVGNKDYIIPIGQILGSAFDFLNQYMKTFSPYSDRYYFVDNSGYLEGYGEEMAYNSATAKTLLSAHINKISLSYSDEEIEAMVPGLQTLMKINTFNLNDILQDFDMEKITQALVDHALFFPSFEKYIQLDENKCLKSSAFEQLLAYASVARWLNGVYVHPTQNAHNEMFTRLDAAMQKHQVAPSAVIYHHVVDSFVNLANRLSAINRRIITKANQLRSVIKELFGKLIPSK